MVVTLHSDPPFLFEICQMYMRICMNFPRLTETLDEAKPERVGAMGMDTRCSNDRIQETRVGYVDG